MFKMVPKGHRRTTMSGVHYHKDSGLLNEQCLSSRMNGVVKCLFLMGVVYIYTIFVDVRSVEQLRQV